MSHKKVIAFDAAPAVFAKLKHKGKKIVQCHGTFDLLHPGHIYHLEEARALGDALVVTVTDERHVNKGPGRPFFNDQLRAKSLAALTCVDYVVLVPHTAAIEAIDCVKPDIYCKGTEYANPDNDVTGNIGDDIAAVKRHGGDVRYIGSVVFSSTKLINNAFENLAAPVKNFCRNLAKTCTPDAFRDAVESLAGLKVLLIGDIIFDRYSNVKMQGLTSKNRILSVRYLNEETQSGGALAIYRHLKQFCQSVKFISLVGREPWVDDVLRSEVKRGEDWIVRDKDFTTIVKQRFNEPLITGKELMKLFAVNYMGDTAPSAATQAAIKKRLAASIADFDVVIVADFGHGLLQLEHRLMVQEMARFMSLNCQTNSNNHGFNIISKQYKRADCFSLDEQELLLACARRPIEYMKELEKLRKSFGASYAWLTRGAVETIGLRVKEKPSLCLPLEVNVVDTVGAGDAFFSVVSLAAAKKLPINLVTFMGQLAGGQAVKIIGNQQPISKATLLKSGMSLLNF
ncbi:MAG TPA: PfkB family carbohydrate kinase [Chthoniobacteraceae bacterium]|nr:PfkB family carbohydrate kinase [Chthoniobacteraceae bacterium]